MKNVSRLRSNTARSSSSAQAASSKKKKTHQIRVTDASNKHARRFRRNEMRFISLVEKTAAGGDRKGLKEISETRRRTRDRNFVEAVVHAVLW